MLALVVEVREQDFEHVEYALRALRCGLLESYQSDAPAALWNWFGPNEITDTVDQELLSAIGESLDGIGDPREAPYVRSRAIHALAREAVNRFMPELTSATK